ncbi:MAG: hypothetical protein L6V86_10295 [Treponema sp.]|nr:MAG: hypothetical protein L6V86_10295 [Treponema sp.]
MNLQTMFAGHAQPLIVLAEPEYKPDMSEAGTILDQDIPEGTDIAEPVTIHLTVSRGPSYENTRVPKLIGLSVNDILAVIARSRIIFDFTSHHAKNGEKAGTVVGQQNLKESSFRIIQECLLIWLCRPVNLKETYTECSSLI